MESEEEQAQSQEANARGATKLCVGDWAVQQLRAAELQFRLAATVRFAAAHGRQPLEFPEIWIHGTQSVGKDEVLLDFMTANTAACFLERSTAYLMAVAIKDAIRAVVRDPKSDPDPNMRAAYQIARLIRNAFAHAPFSPVWSIDADCRDRRFALPDVIEISTSDLHGIPLDWRHYGGPLALFKLSQYVRSVILDREEKSRNSSTAEGR